VLHIVGSQGGVLTPELFEDRHGRARTAETIMRCPAKGSNAGSGITVERGEADTGGHIENRDKGAGEEWETWEEGERREARGERREDWETGRAKKGETGEDWETWETGERG